MAKKKAKVIQMRRGRRKKEMEPEGEHVRQLAPVTSVRSIIGEIISTKAATSEAGQGLSTATKQFAERGGNVPAVRIAARVYAKAKQDGLKARVLWDDVRYYLEECTDFDRIAPTTMFSAKESGQRRVEVGAPSAPPTQAQEAEAVA